MPGSTKMMKIIKPKVEIPVIFDEWAKRHNYSEKSKNKYGYMFATFVRFLDECNISMECVSSTVIQQFVEIKLSNISIKSKLSYLWLIHEIYYDLVEDGEIEINPVYKILAKTKKENRGKQPTRLPLSLSQYERKLFIAYIDSLPRNYQGMLVRCALSLMLHTGLRANELCELKKYDMHLYDDTAWLRVIGKFNKERNVPVPDEIVNDLIEFLDMQEEGLGDCFIQKSGTGNSYTPNGIYFMVKVALKRTNITKVRMSPHILRHTFATTALIAGNTMKQVQQWLGHETSASTDIYVGFVESITGIKTVK